TLGPIDVDKTIGVLFPPFVWSVNSSFIGENIFYSFINNYNYFLYALVLLGLFMGISLKIDKNFLIVFGSLILVCLQLMVFIKNFVPTELAYRFLYYTSILSIPLIGVGIYGTLTKFLDGWNIRNDSLTANKSDRVKKF